MELLHIRKDLGPKSWKQTKLDGKPQPAANVDTWLAEPEHKYPHFPTMGVLSVTVVAPASMQVAQATVDTGAPRSGRSPSPFLSTLARVLVLL